MDNSGNDQFNDSNISGLNDQENPGNLTGSSENSYAGNPGNMSNESGLFNISNPGNLTGSSENSYAGNPGNMSNQSGISNISNPGNLTGSSGNSYACNTGNMSNGSGMMNNTNLGNPPGSGNNSGNAGNMSNESGLLNISNPGNLSGSMNSSVGGGSPLNVNQPQMANSRNGSPCPIPFANGAANVSGGGQAQYVSPNGRGMMPGNNQLNESNMSNGPGLMNISNPGNLSNSMNSSNGGGRSPQGSPNVNSPGAQVANAGNGCCSPQVPPRMSNGANCGRSPLQNPGYVSPRQMPCAINVSPGNQSQNVSQGSEGMQSPQYGFDEYNRPGPVRPLTCATHLQAMDQYFNMGYSHSPFENHVFPILSSPPPAPFNENDYRQLFDPSSPIRNSPVAGPSHGYRGGRGGRRNSNPIAPMYGNSDAFLMQTLLQDPAFSDVLRRTIHEQCMQVFTTMSTDEVRRLIPEFLSRYLNDQLGIQLEDMFNRGILPRPRSCNCPGDLRDTESSFLENAPL